MVLSYGVTGAWEGKEGLDRRQHVQTAMVGSWGQGPPTQLERGGFDVSEPRTVCQTHYQPFT